MESDSLTPAVAAPTEGNCAPETLHVSAEAYSLPTVNESIKTVITTALGYIPAVGPIISALVGLFWPKDSAAMGIWEEIKAEVEKMINQKIDEAVFGLMKQELDGLGKACRLYVGVIKANPHDFDSIREHFISVNTVFVQCAPKFQNPGHEWTLGPLFAIFTQIHISLLRDCVLHGSKWGWSSGVYQYYVELTRQTIEDYNKYFDKVKKNQIDKLTTSQPSKPGQHNIDIYNYWYLTNQRIIILLDDYQLLLEYLDPFKHPDQLREPIPFKDVYSWAYGTADNWDTTAQSVGPSTGVTSRFAGPTAPFEKIYIQLFNYGPRVLDLIYASGTGPLIEQAGKQPNAERVNKVGIIANYSGGVETYTVDIPPPGKDRQFSVQKARVRYGSTPLTISLIMHDEKEIKLFDKRVMTGGSWYTDEVPGRMLTTFNMWTRSYFYDDNMACIIFGYSYDHKYIPPNVSRLLYVTAIDEKTPELIVPDAELRAERDAYWRFIEDCTSDAKGTQPSFGNDNSEK
ncbi:hypothetical protein FRC09_004393 [Ceratobasidium sp. 395]|nr:hypothetical protein FRC09_004393 [Ceratobasidium sp. 395]